MIKEFKIYMQFPYGKKKKEVWRVYYYNAVMFSDVYMTHIYIYTV